MITNGYQKFMQQSVNTMTPTQLVVALLEKAENELQKSLYYIERKQYELTNKSLTKVQDIVIMLESSLKMKYEISDGLSSIYEYLRTRIIYANIHKDAETIKEVMPFFSELKETFEEVIKKGF